MTGTQDEILKRTDLANAASGVLLHFGIVATSSTSCSELSTTRPLRLEQEAFR